jgi:hypothetical protein
VTNPKLKADMSGQAQAYRKLAAERAEKLGLPPPGAPEIQAQTNPFPALSNERMRARDDGKQHQALDSGEDLRLLELHAAGRSHISLAAALNAQGRRSGTGLRTCEPVRSMIVRATTTPVPGVKPRTIG